jgi:hypothetical protein
MYTALKEMNMQNDENALHDPLADALAPDDQQYLSNDLLRQQLLGQTLGVIRRRRRWKRCLSFSCLLGCYLSGIASVGIWAHMNQPPAATADQPTAATNERPPQADSPREKNLASEKEFLAQASRMRLPQTTSWAVNQGSPQISLSSLDSQTWLHRALRDSRSDGIQPSRGQRD